MRAAALCAVLALAGCASTDVTLLDGENGADAGAVVVLDPKSEAERGLLAQANTHATARGRVAVRPANARRYAALTGGIPQAPARFTLYFPEGSTELTAQSAAEFQKVLAEVARRPGAEVQITGHTDTVDDQRTNDRLSLERAREIAMALQAKGLNLEITRLVGRGERELLVPTADGVAEPRNRRVEIIVR